MTTVRPARFGDIPRLKELITECHERSRYAGHRLDMERFRLLCMETIRSGNSCLFVSEVDGVVQGFLMGTIDRLYHILKAKFATDLFFYVSPADRRGGIGLIDAFLAWADSNPDVVTVNIDVNNVVSEDYERVGALLERKGFSRMGAMYERKR